MRKIIRWTLLAVIALAGVPAFAASTSDFYLTLLRRGITEVDAGRYDTAITPLRLAAFGLIESVEHYETAQTYLVIAFDKLGRKDNAREAAQRLMAAERVERKFASLTLPQATRTAFDAVARKVLSAPEVASLTAPVKPSTNPPPTNINPKPVTTPPQTTSSQKPAVSTTILPAPATTTTTTPPPAPKPAATTTTITPPATTPAKPAVTEAKPNPPAPKPKPANPTPTIAAPAPQPRIDVGARIAAGDRALLAANLAEARRAYKEVLDAPGVDHATYIRVGEGFYRARDFADALAAFQRAGTLRSGEEAYRYYIAVAAYETGDYDRAKRELAGALPHIEITEDVQRYRTKIESSR